MPANVYKALIEYSFPSESTIATYISGEFGVLSTAGEARLVIPGDSEVAKYEGSTFFAAGLFGIGIPAGNVVSFHGQVGYRYSKLGEVKTSRGEVLYKVDGSKMTHDYSGFIIRAGIRVNFSSGTGS